jgi:hypothetical protein
MRRALSALFCCLSAVAAARYAAAAQNHVVNGDLHASLNAWDVPNHTGFSRNWTDVRGHDSPGAAAAYVQGTVTGMTTMYTQCIRVTPGISYRIGVWFRYDGGYGTAAQGEMQVDRYDTTDCTYPSGFFTVATSSTSAGLADSWQLLSGTYSNGGYKSFRISLSIGVDTPHDAQGYFDDVYVNSAISGDANGDDVVDVNDVFYLINYLFAGGTPPF